MTIFINRGDEMGIGTWFTGTAAKTAGVTATGGLGATAWIWIVFMAGGIILTIRNVLFPPKQTFPIPVWVMFLIGIVLVFIILRRKKQQPAVII